MYRSSRGNVYYSSSEAILKGLADDGGLFILDKLEEIDFNNSSFCSAFTNTRN